MIQQAPVGLWREAHQQVQIAVRAEILTQGGAEQAQLRDLPAAAKFLQPLVRDGNLLPAHRVSLPAGIIPSSPSGNGDTGWAQIWSHQQKRRSQVGNLDRRTVMKTCGINGRGEWIRTTDLLVPNQAL